MSERDLLLDKYPNLSWDEFERLKTLLEEEIPALRANADPRVLGWALQISMIKVKQYDISTGWKEVAKLNE